MNILVTICARGGSKGVKKKNIRPLMGKPLIAYTIEHAIKWGRATDIIVSTDSTEIADVAKQFGAKIPFIRPAELAADTTPKIPVIRHALKECEHLHNRIYPLVVDLDASAPLRQVADIEGCYQVFLQRRPLTVFSVVNAHKNPYFNMVELDERGWAKPSKTAPSGTFRRQDAPKVYDMNASIYLYDREFLLDDSNNNAISGRSAVFEMDEISGVDIDKEMDFKYVEFLMKEKLFLLN